MRWGQVTLIAAVLLAVGCGTKRHVVQPSSLDFGVVYLGDEHSIDLTMFTLNGESLKAPKFERPLAETGNSSFELVEDVPPGTPPRLVFHPGEEGPLTFSFVVEAEGESFLIPVTGEGKRVPMCPAAEICHRVTFSFTEEKCVVENSANGTPCGPDDCAGGDVCEDGACAYVVHENLPPVCKQDVPFVTLQPAWTYEADANRDLTFPGVVDADGNLYLYDCPHGDGRLGLCSIISLTSDGQRRWRIPESALPSSVDSLPLAVIGGSLFVIGEEENRSHPVLVFRLTDGSFAWQRSDDVLALAAAGTGSVAAILGNSDPASNAVVLVLDTETGAELKRVDDVVPGMSRVTTVSDREGRLYTTAVARSDGPNHQDAVVSALDLEQGRLLWRAVFVNGAGVYATDGIRVFAGGEQVLDAADGHLIYTSSGGSLNLVQQENFTTVSGPEVPAQCAGASLRRVGLNDGVERSSCLLREDDRQLETMTPITPTRDGGTVVLTGSWATDGSAFEQVSLRWSDADGSATYRAHLDGLVFPAHFRALGEPAIVNGRWVMPGLLPSGQSAIIAYDVPGLALAERGWMGAGSQAHDFAPW